MNTTPPSYVYFIRNIGTGDLKIGVSQCPEVRKVEVARAESLPADALALVGGIPHIDAYGLERRLHNRLAAYRRRGEWFSDAPEVNHVVCEFLRDPTCLYTPEEVEL